LSNLKPELPDDIHVVTNDNDLLYFNEVNVLVVEKYIKNALKTLEMPQKCCGYNMKQLETHICTLESILLDIPKKRCIWH